MAQSIRELVDRIIADGVITQAEQRDLNHAILADGMVSDEEKAEIDRLWDLVKSGKIKAAP